MKSIIQSPKLRCNLNLYSHVAKLSMCGLAIASSFSSALANDVFDIAESAADNMWADLKTAVTGWAIGIFFVALIVFVFSKEKTKEYAKNVMIGCVIAFVVANGQSLVENTFSTISGWFAGSSAGSTTTPKA